jgi:hypothetical protein
VIWSFWSVARILNAEHFEFDFAILDAATQRTLRSISPQGVVFKREPQVEDSLIFYILSREDLGEIGRIELVRRGAISCSIETRAAPRPSDSDVIQYLSSAAQTEHAETISIWIEAQRSKLTGAEANYESIPTLQGLSSQEKYQRIISALQARQTTRLELVEKRRSYLEQVMAAFVLKLPEEIAVGDVGTQPSASEFSQDSGLIPARTDTEIAARNTLQIEHSEKRSEEDAPVALRPSKSHRGRKSRYSLETKYEVIMEWEESQQGRGGIEKLDEWEIDVVEPNGAKRLEEFLDDKFGRNSAGNLNVAPRTFQKWGENFRTGKWKVTKTLHKKASKRSRR